MEVKLFKNSVSIHAFGRDTGDWRVSEPNNIESYSKIIAMAKKLGVHTVWYPRAGTCNAKIVTKQDFPPNKCFSIDEVEIMTGIEASGCPVGKGEAFFIASADCPTIVVQDEIGQVVCAHASREELIDQHWVRYDHANPGRKFESVVDAIASHYGHPLRHTKIFSGFGIREGFRHDPANEKYVGYNDKLDAHIRRRFGVEINCFDLEHNLSLELLIKLQWLRYGVHHQNMMSDRVCTKTDIGDDNQFVWHSRARDDAKSGRNGIFVVVH